MFLPQTCAMYNGIQHINLIAHKTLYNYNSKFATDIANFCYQLQHLSAGETMKLIEKTLFNTNLLH